MKKVKFTKKSLYGEKGEERDVTDRAAASYIMAGIAEYADKVKEEKAPAETKEEKQAQKADKKQVKLTKSPR